MSGLLLARTLTCAIPSTTQGSLCRADHPSPKACPRAQHPAHRRHQARDPSLADDKVEDLYRPRVCAQSWLSTWRNRSDAHTATWAQERPQNPTSPPTHTPEHVARAVVSLHLTVLHNGTGGGATALMQARAQHGIDPGPARRTLSCLLRRHHTEGQERRFNASIRVLPVVTGFCLQPPLSTVAVRCSSPEPDPNWRTFHVYPVV